MDTKAAFEKWWKDQCKQLPPKKLAFSAWQASRSAIEIELPEHCNGRTPDAVGYDDAIDDCIEAITSHGIRIKGKTE